MSHVYFLGAGFSAAYGLPVMNDFFRVARENPLITADEKKFLAEVQRFAHMGVRLVTISRNNMEEILSFLEMAEQAKQIPQRLNELSKVGDKTISPAELLKSIIALVYGPLDSSKFALFSNLSLSRRAFAMFGLDGHDPSLQFPPTQQRSLPSLPNKHFSPPTLRSSTFITTNYDLCLETHLLQIHPQLTLNLIGDWISAEGHAQGDGDRSGIYDIKSPAKLIRLHGAVNWNSPGYGSNGRTYKFRVTSKERVRNNFPKRDVPSLT